MNTTAAILKAARDLIAKPENWTQGRYASNRHGTETFPNLDDAECFCSAGAIYRSLGLSISKPLPREFISALGFGRETDIYEFNDMHGHSEVLDLFSKAIKAAEGEQP